MTKTTADVYVNGYNEQFPREVVQARYDELQARPRKSQAEKNSLARFTKMLAAMNALKK